MSAQVWATKKPNITQESIDALLEHTRMLSAAFTQIQNGQGSTDQTKMDTLIAFIKGTPPLPKSPLVYARNLGQVYSNSIID